jgi:DNA invertase Pin-like site-specific DNA recombinase
MAKLKDAGCTVVRTEKISARSRDGRSELEAVMAFIRPDDVLVVVKLDRLGRSTRDVLNLVHELEQKGASLKVLEPEIDTAGPMGRMVLTVLGMVAEMELGFIRDRQRAGIDAAKAKGVYKGRPVTFDRARIVALRKEGMGATEIARAVGCKRGNVYKTLKAAGLT